jgi:hypothetical protein
MNSTQKLTDEALQVYRATGLSPLEVMAQHKALFLKLDEVLEKKGKRWHPTDPVLTSATALLEACK